MENLNISKVNDQRLENAVQTRKQIIRKVLNGTDIIICVLRFLMCINDVPPEMMSTQSISLIFRNTLIGILSMLLGAGLIYVAKHGFTITWED